MIYSATSQYGFKLEGLDGDLGVINEYYFDDRHWAIRYVVVDTGTWLAERLVLLSPHALQSVKDRRVQVNLTMKQIEDSPLWFNDKPVSEQFETAYYEYYGFPMYWAGPYMWGSYPFIPRGQDNWNTPPVEGKSWDHHLRSTRAVSGYHIRTPQGDLGHIEDFLIDEALWAIRYLVIKTNNWWPGKRVLLSPHWIESIDWSESKALVSISREIIKESPEFTKESVLDRDYEIALHRHYSRHGYWEEMSTAAPPLTQFPFDPLSRRIKSRQEQTKSTLPSSNRLPRSTESNSHDKQ